MSDSPKPPQRHPIKLGSVQETLLIPLGARAAESRTPWGLFKDSLAISLTERVDYDFSKLPLGVPTRVAVAARTMILDKVTRAFVAEHPDALILNLAAGLDTRYWRLGGEFAQWVDVDLPDAMALRRDLLPDEPNRKTIAASVKDEDWLAEVPRAPGQPMLILIEGLFMYLDREETRAVLERLARRFPGAEVVFEMVSTLAAAQGSAYLAAGGFSARFRGGLDDGREVERWDPRFRFVEEWKHFEAYPLRWGFWGLLALVPLMRDFMRLVRIRLSA